MFKKVLEYAGDYRKTTYAAAVVMVAGVICSIIPYQLIDPLLAHQSLEPGFIAVRIVAIGICGLLYALLYVKGLSLSHESAYHTLENIRISLQGKLEQQPLGAIKDKGVGTLKKLFIDDIESIELLLAHALPEGIANISVPACVFIAMFFVDWKLALLSLCSLPLGMMAMMATFRVGMNGSEAYYGAARRMNNTIVEYVNGMEVVKATERRGRPDGASGRCNEIDSGCSDRGGDRNSSGDKKLCNQNEIINFTDGVEEVSLVLHFESEGAVYKIEDINSEEPAVKEVFSTSVIRDIKKGMKEYLIDQIDSIEYKLGGVCIPDEEDLPMYPKSLAFAFSRKDGKNRHTLNIYVQISDAIDDTGHYKGHKGNSEPSFRPEREVELPVPDGCTASLILSHDLMEELYFKQQMEKLGFIVSFADAPGKVGINLNVVPIKGSINYNGTPDARSGWSYSMDSGSINFENNPVKINLKDQSVFIAWSYQSTKMHYEAYQGMVTGPPQPYHGNITVEASIGDSENGGKEMPLKIDKNGKISWEISLIEEFEESSESPARKDYNVYAEASDTGEWLIKTSVAGRFENSTEAHVERVLPTFVVDLQAINAIMLGSLLFPGKHLFEISNDAGCYAPRDFVIFGDLADKFDEEKKKNAGK